MGPGDYHSVDALGYDSLDSIRGTGLESCLFLPHNHPVLRGGGRPLVLGSLGTLRVSTSGLQGANSCP
jgi:hypothetical protein